MPIPRWGLIAVGLLLMGRLCCCASTLDSNRVTHLNRLNVPELVEALKSGDLKAGDKLPHARLPKGWSGTSVKDSDGSIYGTYVVMDDDYLVMIYIGPDDQMYAASAYSEINRKRWFLCDTNMMRKRIEASKKPPRSNPLFAPERG